jgi:hypothetical protein
MTQYEFEDYRNNQPPRLGTWPFWAVPNFLVMTYLFRLALVLYLLPIFFGIKLTVLGFFLNFLLIDLFTYLSFKKVYGLE